MQKLFKTHQKNAKSTKKTKKDKKILIKKWKEEND